MELDTPTNPAVEPAGTEHSKAPEPSYAPFLLALGVTMLFWGLATSPVMSAGGFVVFGWALWMWISEIAKGWRN